MCNCNCGRCKKNKKFLSEEKNSEILRQIHLAIKDEADQEEIQLKDINDNLEDIDNSIDYLTGALTGRSAIDVDANQKVFGKFNFPKNITKKGLKEIVKEIIISKTKK